jgi:cation diffusion facilitator CzcD-associated flavoprotein CzcO
MAVSNADGTHADLIIVGAGISGIDAAYRLKTRCPDRSWLILEARERIGGTWDLFRFPGVRSDSDMFTLGFPFRPWRSDLSIVDGPSIRQYVEDTAREYAIFDKIRFGHKAVRANWSSKDARWTIEAEEAGRTLRLTSSFLYFASGYYDYAAGHRPRWDGEEDFRGRIVHPQFWPEDVDYAGKRIAVIGSGATAVTMVPALAETAAHVTMVQRTPSYIVARPARDPIARGLQRFLPAALADRLVRWKNVLLTMFSFWQARKRPRKFSDWIAAQLSKALPPDYPIERDFRPPYDPWDQRLCLVPDGDLFAAMRSGKVSIATGVIDRFTPGGLRMASGETIDCDIIVTATGLAVKLLGGIELSVDGEPVRPSDLMIYKGMMLSGVPNLFIAFGYTNASWTLRSDLTARSVCRLLNRMKRDGHEVCAPRADPGAEPRPVMELTSGYVRRAEATLPKQGHRHPWRVPQNYLRDTAAMTFRPIDEGLEFRKAAR